MNKKNRNSETKIKLIKKEDLSRNKNTAVPLEKDQSPAAESRITSTISDWVSEFQKRRREETDNALKRLYNQRLQSAKDFTIEAI